MRAYFKWRLFTTHLGTSHHSKWHVHTINKLFSSFTFHYSIYAFPPFISVILISSFSVSIIAYPFLPFVLFNSRIIIIILLLCCLFCSLEENLRTYLTTWLSSCRVIQVSECNNCCLKLIV